MRSKRLSRLRERFSSEDSHERDAPIGCAVGSASAFVALIAALYIVRFWVRPDPDDVFGLIAIILSLPAFAACVGAASGIAVWVWRRHRAD